MVGVRHGVDPRAQAFHPQTLNPVQSRVEGLEFRVEGLGRTFLKPQSIPSPRAYWQLTGPDSWRSW